MNKKDSTSKATKKEESVEMPIEEAVTNLVKAVGTLAEKVDRIADDVSQLKAGAEQSVDDSISDEEYDDKAKSAILLYLMDEGFDFSLLNDVDELGYLKDGVISAVNKDPSLDEDVKQLLARGMELLLSNAEDYQLGKEAGEEVAQESKDTVDENLEPTEAYEARVKEQAMAFLNRGAFAHTDLPLAQKAQMAIEALSRDLSKSSPCNEYQRAERKAENDLIYGLTLLQAEAKKSEGHCCGKCHQGSETPTEDTEIKVVKKPDTEEDDGYVTIRLPRRHRRPLFTFNDIYEFEDFISCWFSFPFFF